MDTINSNGTVPQATQGYNPLAISSSTNATPIEVTTGSAHGYNEGDTVAVEGHRTNTNANGLWAIHVTASNKFTLLGSTGNGVGGATGYTVDYAINPLLQVPTDLVDDVDASTVNPVFEGLFDLSPFLYQRVGQYSLYNIARVAHVDTIDAATWSTTTVTPNTWTALTSASWAYQWPFARDVNIFNTDILVVKFTARVEMNFGSITGNALALGADFGGGLIMVNGTPIPIQDNFIGGVTLEATLRASDFTGTHLNSVTVGIMGYQTTVGNQTFKLDNPYHMDISHYRINQ